jgi:hypothetical protein
MTLVILSASLPLTHTRFTYHRTWETGLGAGIRVTVANPAFFYLPRSLIDLITR